MKTSSIRFVARTLAALVACSLLPCIAVAAPLISDTNLLSGLAANPSNFNVSSYFQSGANGVYGPSSSDYGPQNATNGTGGGPTADFVFDPNDGSQVAAITGFNSAINDIRIWSGDLRPLHVTIESSTTSKTSLTPGDYSTTLVPLTSLAGTWSSTGTGYVDFAVNAPVGTQSLLFIFGPGQDTTGNTGFARISELQAFAPPVPEPSSLILCGLGAIGLLVAARRRRKV